jgi:hypothetical protein
MVHDCADGIGFCWCCWDATALLVCGSRMPRSHLPLWLWSSHQLLGLPCRTVLYSASALCGDAWRYHVPGPCPLGGVLNSSLSAGVSPMRATLLLWRGRPSPRLGSTRHLPVCRCCRHEAHLLSCWGSFCLICSASALVVVNPSVSSMCLMVGLTERNHCGTYEAWALLPRWCSVSAPRYSLSHSSFWPASLLLNLFSTVSICRELGVGPGVSACASRGVRWSPCDSICHLCRWHLDWFNHFRRHEASQVVDCAWEADEGCSHRCCWPVFATPLSCGLLWGSAEQFWP